MANSESLISLVYLSAAVFPFSPQDLAELLAKSRASNSALGITGMLLFKEGKFLQVLVGEREAVLTLYEKIAKDPRHQRLTTLSEAAAARDFPESAMGFHDLNSADAVRTAGFSDFLDISLTAADFFSDPARAKRLLSLFKEKEKEEESLLVKGTSAG
jgi:hypothetical protein